MQARSRVDSLRACPISCSHDGLSADPRQILHGLKAVQDDASTKQGFSSDANPPRGVILNPASAGEGSGVQARSRVDGLRACPISCSHDGLSADPRQILHGLKAVQDDAMKY